MWGINNQAKYVFYYDESNNCRKFWVDDSKQQFNTDYTADFVLAGLVKKEEDTVDVSLETFRRLLKLQGNVEEIKFKKLYAKGDFLHCVKEKRLFETLSWIDKSPFYIHYTNVNNLFYTLVEIFDSIVGFDEISEFGYDYLKMKSVFYYMFNEKSTHNRRECPVYGHRGGSRGRFYYRITTFEGRPWDARDPHKTTFMTLKHAIRLSIWRKQKETPGVEKAPGVSSPQRKESGRSGRDDGELRFGYDPAIHARRLRVYHRPRRLRMASRISIFFAARRFEPLNSMG